MEDKNKTIVILISLFVVGFMLLTFFGINFSRSEDDSSYLFEEMGVSFNLSSGYLVKGFESTDGLFRGFEIYEDNSTTRALLNGQMVGELPVSISCFAFNNPEDLSIEQWIITEDFKKVFFVENVNLQTSDYVPNVSDYEYFSDGLYATKNVIFKDKNNKIFNCRVTYITLEDQIINEFLKILSSIKFF